MTNEEIELSFCFLSSTKNETLLNLLKTKLFNNVEFVHVAEQRIADYYLAKDVRVREVGHNIYLYKKTGSKSFKREEHSIKIDPRVIGILKDQVRLVVKKTRNIYTLSTTTPSLDGEDKIYVMIDDVTHPMKVKMVEIECGETTFKILTELNEKIKPLKRNIKPAWEYFYRKIGFIGAPSSGKTTMARALVNTLSINYGVPIEQIAEYARTFISRYGVPEWYLQPLIEWGQDRREYDARHSTMLVTDSPTFLPYLYALYNFESKLDESAIQVFSKMYKSSLVAAKNYTDLIYLRPQMVQSDGIRVQNDEDSLNLSEYITRFLKQHNIDHITCDYKKNIEDLIIDMFNINVVEESDEPVQMQEEINESKSEKWYEKE